MKVHLLKKQQHRLHMSQDSGVGRTIETNLGLRIDLEPRGLENGIGKGGKNWVEEVSLMDLAMVLDSRLYGDPNVIRDVTTKLEALIRRAVYLYIYISPLKCFLYNHMWSC